MTSLLNVIAEYQTKWQRFLAIQHEHAPKDYKPAMDTLQEWKAPAQTREEAIAALTLAIEFEDIGESPIVSAMMKCALGFLDGTGARQGHTLNQRAIVNARRRMKAQIEELNEMIDLIDGDENRLMDPRN